LLIAAATNVKRQQHCNWYYYAPQQQKLLVASCWLLATPIWRWRLQLLAKNNYK